MNKLNVIELKVCINICPENKEIDFGAFLAGFCLVHENWEGSTPEENKAILLSVTII